MDKQSIPTRAKDSSTDDAGSSNNIDNSQMDDENRDAKLINAALEGDETLVSSLLDKGADPCATDSQGTTCLHAAAQQGHEAIVRRLLEHGADLSSKTPRGWTVLHSACVYGHEATVRLLLDYGASLSAARDNGETPVHIAAYRGHAAVVKLLLDREAKFPGVTESGGTLQPVAVQSGNENAGRTLLNKGGDASAIQGTGVTSLHAAAASGNLDIVRILLDRGSDVFAVTTARAGTALHIAAENGHADVIELLVERGSNISAQDKRGFTALHVASIGGHELSVERLLGSCVEKFCKNGFSSFSTEGGNDPVPKLRSQLLSTKSTSEKTALYLAAEEGEHIVVKVLLAYGADPLTKNENGLSAIEAAFSGNHSAVLEAFLSDRGPHRHSTATTWARILRTAAFKGDASTTKLLLEQGVEDSAEGEKGWNGLFVAAAAGHDAVVKLFLEHGGDVFFTARNGWTALIGAAEGGHEDTVRLLLEYGSEPSSTAEDGWTALLAAARYGRLAVVRILLDHGADISSKHEGGEATLAITAEGNQKEVIEPLLQRRDEDKSQKAFALFLAARNGHEEVVKCLLNRGAPTSAKTEEGATALHIAAGKGYVGIVELLLNGGLASSATKIGITPLRLAVAEGRESCVRVLLQREPHIMGENLGGNTPLHVAAEKGYEAIARLLLEKGVDYSALNREGLTAADVAKQADHEKIAKLILEYRPRVPKELLMHTNNLAALFNARTLDSKHKHQRLPNGANYIRLLYLNAPGTDVEVISGNLVMVYLDNAPEYVALSYAWGEPKFDHQLVCDGREMLITTNLHQALRRLCSTAQRLFWIDQICIDQSDIPEVSQQVGIMSRIYSQAKSVYIWLGDHDETTAEGLSMARFVVDSLEEAEGKTHSKGIPEFWLYNKPGLSYNETWLPWARLYSKRWFSRLWVVQEYVCAREHRIFCGNFEIPKQLFLSVLLTHKNLEIEDNPISTALSQGGAGRTVSYLETMESLRDVRHPIATLIAGLTQDFGCSDHRDKIFALLGIVTDDPERPKPDYSLLPSEVYPQFARYYIGTGFANGGLMLNYSGLDFTDSKLGLPTWCPDWASGMASDVFKVQTHRAAMSLPKRAVLHQDPKLVVVDGCHFDVIADVGPRYPEGLFINLYKNYLAWFESSVHLLEHPLLWRYKNTAPLQLWSRLIVRGAFPGDEATLSYLKFHNEIVVKAQVLKDWEKTQNSSEKPSDPELSDDSKDVDKESVNSTATGPTDGDRQATADTQQENTTEDGKVDKGGKGRPTLSIPDVTCFRKLGNCFKHRVCITAGGYIGIAGLNAQIGDHVSILFGLGTIRVLRKKGEVFQNVGTISLLDLTDDDISEAAKRRPSEITLC
jgi:ankyrin repeat protein